MYIGVCTSGWILGLDLVDVYTLGCIHSY
jgi:hypothetical protein